MNNRVTVTTRQSWLSRVAGAIVGILVGIVLFLGAFPLLWWNEGRAVHRARSLEEGASAVISVPVDTVNAGNEAKLVHLTGLATTDAVVADPDFGISATALRLVRTAETYLWHEEKKSEKRTKLGGSEETKTTYRYTTRWSEAEIDSSQFYTPAGHENPVTPWRSTTFTAERVTLGAFTLPSELVSKIDRRDDRPVLEADAQLPPAASGFVVSEHQFYRGQDPSNPEVGDVRVRFEVINPQTVSVVASQRGSTLEAYRAQAGSTILLLQGGEVGADQMFAAARRSNTILTWVLRLAGFLAMFIGLLLVARPISVVGSVVPLVGRLLGAGFGLVSFVVAAAFSLVIVAAAWLAYRPLLAVGLLALALATLVIGIMSRRRKAPPAQVLPPPLPVA